MTDDRIVLKGMVFHGYTGVLAFEKEKGQKFVVDLELRLGRIRACETDALADTVDYGAVFREVASLVENGRDDLIERLAERIARQILDLYPQVRSLAVTVKKPMAPVAGTFAYMAVAIERSQEREV